MKVCVCWSNNSKSGKEVTNAVAQRLRAIAIHLHDVKAALQFGHGVELDSEILHVRDNVHDGRTVVGWRGDLAQKVLTHNCETAQGAEVIRGKSKHKGLVSITRGNISGIGSVWFFPIGST